jgi:hypothetical protein
MPDNPPSRHQFVLSEVQAERHAARCLAGDYDDVAGPIAPAERTEAEAELDDPNRVALTDND